MTEMPECPGCGVVTDYKDYGIGEAVPEYCEDCDPTNEPDVVMPTCPACGIVTEWVGRSGDDSQPEYCPDHKLSNQR